MIPEFHIHCADELHTVRQSRTDAGIQITFPDHSVEEFDADNPIRFLGGRECPCHLIWRFVQRIQDGLDEILAIEEGENQWFVTVWANSGNSVSMKIRYRLYYNAPSFTGATLGVEDWKTKKP